MLARDNLILQTLALKIAKPQVRMVEVGSWKGSSTSVLAYVAQAWGGKVFAVDHWKGSIGTGLEISAKDWDIFRVFCNNMRMSGIEGTVEVVKMESKEAVGKFEDKSIDLIFLDGDHRYNEFKEDILNWMPKIKDGGILCGHDCDKHYRSLSDTERQVVDRNLDKDFIEGIGHPGVMKGLYELLGDECKKVSDSTIWYHIMGGIYGTHN